MGCGITVACRTCKQKSYVGYGSYMTWMDHVNTLAEFDAAAVKNPEIASRKKNQDIRKVLVAHDGHDLYWVNWDYHDTKGPTLIGDFGDYGTPVEVIPDYGDYTEMELG